MIASMDEQTPSMNPFPQVKQMSNSQDEEKVSMLVGPENWQKMSQEKKIYVEEKKEKKAPMPIPGMNYPPQNISYQPYYQVHFLLKRLYYFQAWDHSTIQPKLSATYDVSWNSAPRRERVFSPPKFTLAYEKKFRFLSIHSATGAKTLFSQS